MFNPVLYLVSGLRWSFYEISDVNVWASLGSVLFLRSALLWSGYSKPDTNCEARMPANRLGIQHVSRSPQHFGAQ